MGALQVIRHIFTQFTSNLAYFNSITVSENLNAVSANTFSGTSAYFTNITGFSNYFNTITVTSSYFNTVLFCHLYSTNEFLTNLTVTNVTSTTHTGTNEFLTNIKATTITGTFAYIPQLSGTLAFFTAITGSKIYGGTGTFSYLSAVNLYFPGNQTITYLTTTDHTGTSDFITNIYTNTMTGTTVFITNSKITNLTATTMTGSNLGLTSTPNYTTTTAGALVVGGGVGVGGSIWSSNLYTGTLYGTANTQTTDDTLYIGVPGGDGDNFFLDRGYAGAIIIGYNTPKITCQNGILQIYSNSSYHTLLFGVNSAGTIYGAPGVSIYGNISGNTISSGYVGQFLSSVISSGSSVSMANVTATNITSISPSPGVWLVWGNAYFSGSTINEAYAWIDTSTFPALPDPSLHNGIYTSNPQTKFAINTTQIYLNTSITNEVSTYLCGQMGGSGSECGGIYAVRIA